MTERDYQKLAASSAPRSPLGKNCLWAFAVGGLLCAATQMLANVLQNAGLPAAQARLTGSLTLILLSALATGLHIYDDLGRRAGAGLSVPITGFANSIAAAAVEFRSEGLVPGMAARMFNLAGPVLVFGISASVLYGLALYGLSYL